MENEIYHHGTKGMRWGIRRFQRKDGSLTPAGRKRYGQNSTDKTQAKIDSINKKTAEQIKKIKSEGKAASRIAKAEEAAAAKIAKAEAKYKPKSKADASKPKSKPVSEMTDDELRDRINRIQLEKQLASLTPKETSRGQKFMTSVLNDVVAPAAKTAGKKLLTDFLEDRLGTALGLDKKGNGDGDDWLKKLAKENDRMSTIKKNDELNKYFKDKKAAGSDSDGGKKTKGKTKDSDDGGKKTKDSKEPDGKASTERASDEFWAFGRKFRKTSDGNYEPTDEVDPKIERDAKRNAERDAKREVREELEREREFNEVIRNSEKQAKKWIDAEFTEIDADDVIDTAAFNRGEQYVFEFMEDN